MRSIIFKWDKLKKTIKIIDRIMIFISILTLAILATCAVKTYIEKKFIYPLKYADLIFEQADDNGLDRGLVLSVVKVESGFKKTAESSAGAIGLMQITPATGEYVASLLNVKEYDLKNENTNIVFGCYYLKYLVGKFKNLDTALCAYNAGEGNVSRWLSNTEYSNDGKVLEKIPFKETEEYLRKIKKSYKKYNELYRNILDKNKKFE